MKTDSRYKEVIADGKKFFRCDLYMVQYIERKKWRDFYVRPTETFQESFARLKVAKEEYPSGTFRIVRTTIRLTTKKVDFDKDGNVK